MRNKGEFHNWLSRALCTLLRIFRIFSLVGREID